MEQDNFRRDAEANGESGGADAGRDEQMPAVFDDEAFAVAGRGDGRAEKREIDLSAVGVAGEGDADAFGDFGEDIGVVGDEKYGLRRVGLGERSGDVGVSGPHIADAGQPKSLVADADADGLVGQHGNAVGLDGGADGYTVDPPIVIAQDGVDAKGCVELGEDGRIVAGRDVGAAEVDAFGAADGEVAEQDDEVGVGRIGAVDDVAEMVKVVIGRADVEVGEGGNGEGPFPVGRERSRVRVVSELGSHQQA